MGAALYFDQKDHPDQLAMNLVKSQAPYVGALTKHSILQAMGNVAGLSSGASSTARTLAGMFLPVPPILGQVARGTMTRRDVRDANPVMGALKQGMANVLGLASSLPPRLSPYGREEPAAEGLVGALTDPTSPLKGYESPADSMAQSVGAKIKEPASAVSFGRQKFTRSPAEQLAYERAAGPLAEQAVAALFQSPEFQNLPANRKAPIVAHVVELARKGAPGFVPQSVPQGAPR